MFDVHKKEEDGIGLIWVKCEAIRLVDKIYFFLLQIYLKNIILLFSERIPLARLKQDYHSVSQLCVYVIEEKSSCTSIRDVSYSVEIEKLKFDIFFEL